MYRHCVNRFINAPADETRMGVVYENA